MIGRMLSRYRIVERLGEGGMGVVYRAEDIDHGRAVALKILHPGAVGGEAGRERLAREARACVALQHPNITEVFEVGEADGVAFVAMELVAGETLRSAIARGPIPWREAVRIGCQVASALARAHRQGLIHRDIKSDNIMIAPDGRVKVLDFGLSRTLIPDSADAAGERVTRIDRITRIGSLLGTFEYMSPEQAQGRDTGPASDTFSLGVVIYEMLTAELPFHGDNLPALIHAVVFDEPQPVRGLRPEIPAALERLVQRSLQKRVDRRFADGGALESELRQMLHGGAVVEPQAAAASLGTAPTAGRLIGRDAELGLLREVARAAAAGPGRAAWIAGEAGAGKSRLLQELATHSARSGALVLRGECPVREGVRPYHPFAEALTEYVHTHGVARFGQLAEHLDRLEPGLSRIAGNLASLLQMEAPGGDAPLSRDQVVAAVSELLTALSRQQAVLLLLDDLHWADRETLDLTQSLLRSLPRLRLLLVGSFRPEDLAAGDGATHPLVRLLERADRETSGIRLSLRRLDREETAELLEDLLGGARAGSSLLEGVYGRTEGNPLFVIELLQMLRAEGALERRRGGAVQAALGAVGALPVRVRDLIDRRLALLAEGDRRLLEAAAIEGAAFHSSTLEACLGWDRLEVLTRLQGLERERQLVHAEEERYRFDHALIREALTEGMIPELRREMHRRVGAHLIERWSDRPEHAAAIAYQLREARDDQAAIPYLLTAASAARHVFSNEAAIDYLAQAEGILSRRLGSGEAGDDTVGLLMRVHLKRGEIRQLVGRDEEAMEDFRALEKLARGAHDVMRVAMSHNRIGELLRLRGDYDGALDAVAQARLAAGPIADERALADAATLAGQVHFHRGEFDAALAAHGEALEARRRGGDLARAAHDLNKIGNIRYYRGDYEGARGAYEEALGMERENGDRRGMAESLMNLGSTWLQLGDAAASLDHHRAALALKRDIGDRRSLAMSLNNLGLALESLGRLDDARSHHEESLAIKREIGDPRGVSISLSNLAEIYQKTGFLEAGLKAAEESLALKEKIQDQMSVPYALNTIGALLLSLGRPQDAEQRHEEALRRTREIGDRTEEAHTLCRMGELRLARGEPAAACGPLAAALALARQVGVRQGEIDSLFALGQAELSSGRLEAAAIHAASLEQLAAGGAPEIGAKADRLWGQLLAARGDAKGAAARFRRALERAAEGGLRDLQWRLHVDLAAVLGNTQEGEDIRRQGAILLDDLAARIADSGRRQEFRRAAEQKG